MAAEKPSELLAQAMLVDKRCKRHARECGIHAQKLAQDAREDTSGVSMRIKEVLANNLNEAAGKMRFNPPKPEEVLKKSATDEFTADVLRKGIVDVVSNADSVVVNGQLGSILDAEYDPIGKSWEFDLTLDDIEADFVVLVCKSVNGNVRRYVMKKGDISRHTFLDYQAAPVVGRLEIPRHDVEFLDYRDNLDLFI